jgi:hypothetical protein
MHPVPGASVPAHSVGYSTSTGAGSRADTKSKSRQRNTSGSGSGGASQPSEWRSDGDGSHSGWGNTSTAESSTATGAHMKTQDSATDFESSASAGIASGFVPVLSEALSGITMPQPSPMVLGKPSLAVPSSDVSTAGALGPATGAATSSTAPTPAAAPPTAEEARHSALILSTLDALVQPSKTPHPHAVAAAGSATSPRVSTARTGSAEAMKGSAHSAQVCIIEIG